MRTVFISAGHSNTPGRDRGAYGNGLNEGDLTVEFRNLVIAELAKIGVKAERDGDNSVTGETVNFIRKKLFPSSTVFVDFHFNAGPPAATGSEVIIPDNPSEFEKGMADELSAYIASTLQLRNRGRKTEANTARKQLVWMRTAGENILPEICFITNTGDVKSYQSKKVELAAGIASIIKKWASK